MDTVQSEIAALEERLRLAELGPDPKFFEEVLAETPESTITIKFMRVWLKQGNRWQIIAGSVSK